jgi:hypothetical protein
VDAERESSAGLWLSIVSAFFSLPRRSSSPVVAVLEEWGIWPRRRGAMCRAEGVAPSTTLSSGWARMRQREKADGG